MSIEGLIPGGYAGVTSTAYDTPAKMVMMPTLKDRLAESAARAEAQLADAKRTNGSKWASQT